MLISAFIGGLILNLMPACSLSCQSSSSVLLKHAESHPEVVRRENFAYVAGVIFFIFGDRRVSCCHSGCGKPCGVGLSVAIALFFGPDDLVFFALSLNLAGLFEIDFLDAG